MCSIGVADRLVKCRQGLLRGCVVQDDVQLDADARLTWERVNPILRLARSLRSTTGPLCVGAHEIYAANGWCYCKKCSYECRLGPGSTRTEIHPWKPN